MSDINGSVLCSKLLKAKKRSPRTPKFKYDSSQSVLFYFDPDVRSPGKKRKNRFSDRDEEYLRVNFPDDD